MKSCWQTYFFAACIGTMLVAVSCEGDEDPPFDKTQLVGKWTLTSQTVGTTEQSQSEVALEPCVLDNILELMANGEFEISEGENECTPGSPATIDEGVWTLTGDKLVMDGDNEAVNCTLLLLSGSSMKLKFNIEVAGNDALTIVTYSKVN